MRKALIGNSFVNKWHTFGKIDALFCIQLSQLVPSLIFCHISKDQETFSPRGKASRRIGGILLGGISLTPS
jgi:hypothetical protein